MPKPEKRVDAARPRRTAAPRLERDEKSILRDVGALIRNERAKRGMTRRALAAACQTSERYLAQIESGAGNPSVLVLDAIARVFGLTPADLMPAGEAFRRLRNLAPDKLAALLRALDAPAASAANRAQRIALIGLRGAGKSTLGAALAARLAVPFIEIDKMVEQEYGAPVATLFEVYGQGTFRRYERECLQRIVAECESAVIATAGGIVADDGTFSQLLDQTHVIWLQASPAEHMRRVMEQGDFRPMSHNRDAMNDLVAILDARAADYGRAHARLDTSGKDVATCLEELAPIATRLFG
jgi:XRE family transcriptional regulator, aerobic/anaerobic benzoate catabolism transcriptional regulator